MSHSSAHLLKTPIPGLDKKIINACAVRSDFYSFHGTTLCISSDEAKLLEVIRFNLKHFFCKEPDLSLPAVYLSFLSCEDPRKAPFKPKPASVPVSFSGDLKYYTEEKQLFTVFPDKFVMMCQLDEGWAAGFFSPAILKDSWSIHQLLFYPPLAELLKQQHIFNMHAALVASKHNKAVLLTAPTGHGKSTTLFNLVRSGYKFLSDDISMVKKTASGLRLLGFPEPVSLRPDALEKFPELAFLKNDPSHCRNSKYSFRVEKIYSGCLSTNALPGWIVFPQVKAGAPTRLLPLSKREALSLLIPQSVIVANKTIVKEHFALLTQLVKDCYCFRLQLGKDANTQVPHLFAGLQ